MYSFPLCQLVGAVAASIWLCLSVSQSVSFAISQSPSHSVNLSRQFDTINMHRHQLNCISFIAKQQQQLLPKIRWVFEEGAWPTGVKFHFTLLPYTSMRNKTEKTQKKKTEKQAENKSKPHTTEMQCGMAKAVAKGMRRSEPGTSYGMLPWKLPLSQELTRGKPHPPIPLSPHNTYQTMGAMTEKRVKHKHHITKRFSSLYVSFFPSVLKSNFLKLWGTLNDLQIA